MQAAKPINYICGEDANEKKRYVIHVTLDKGRAHVELLCYNSIKRERERVEGQERERKVLKLVFNG